MSGSLSSLNTALTALRFNRIAIDVASNNVANATTEGYTRRRVVGESLGTSSVPALWSRYPGAEGSVGTGVGLRSVDRLNDAFLDARSRREHAAQSYLAVRSTVLQRVETGIGEPGDTGVAAAISDLRGAWHDLGNDPGSDAARGQVLARGLALVDAVRVQATNIDTELSDQRGRLLGVVSETTTVAKELAATNKAVASAALDGVDTSSLLDQRDQLAQRLAQLVGGTATQRADGGLDVTVGGVALVTGEHAGTLTVTGGVTPTGADDGSPVSYAVVDPLTGTSTAVPSGLRGELGAITDLLTTTLPAYADGLSAVVAALADEMNVVHAASYDRAGATGRDFFSYTPGDAARTLQVALTAPSQVAASATPGGVLDGSAAAALGLTGESEGAYQRLVAGFGTEVASVRRLAATQQLLTTQVDAAREQLSGVNLDEEMVSMLSAQRSYEAAARVMTVVDSVLDTLINRTGLLR
jgi:flagellar hook-associated protein 1 FlgK